MDVASLLQSPAVFVAVFAGAGAALLFYILRVFREGWAQQAEEDEPIPVHHGKKPVTKPKKKHAGPKPPSTSTSTQTDSRYMFRNCKGHTGQVHHADYSSNGKYLATCAEDRTVLLWDARDLAQKDVKSLRVNVEFDHATFVKWSPDSKAFIIQKYNDNTIEVYKIEKKKDGWLGHATKALTYPKEHQTDVIGIGIAGNGKYIMSCSNKTDLIVWDLKGQKLAEVDTCLMSTTCAKISPCSKFIVASGFAPDAHVYEVVFTRTGEFQEVKKAFDLTGHTSGIYDVAFDADSSHMATVSKDGTWKLFDTKIEYKKREDPHLKVTGKYQQSSSDSLIALSPNAEVVAIATGNSLAFYSALTGQHDYTIEGVYSGRITCILFDATGKLLVASGDKYVKVFHNVTGYRCNIASAKEKLKQHQTSATKERLEKLIEDCEAFLETIEK